MQNTQGDIYTTHKGKKKKLKKNQYLIFINDPGIMQAKSTLWKCRNLTVSLKHYTALATAGSYLKVFSNKFMSRPGNICGPLFNADG